MTAGTLPSRRSARAAPLPVSVRAVAASVAEAMTKTCDPERKMLGTTPGYPRPAAPERRRDRLSPGKAAAGRAGREPGKANGGRELVKERADRLLAVGEADGLGEQVAHGEHVELGAAALGGDGDGVRDRHLGDRRLGQALRGGAG